MFGLGHCFGSKFKRRNKQPLGHIFRSFEMCFTSLRALVWSANDGLVRVQDCIMSVFQSAWFGKNSFGYSPRARQAREFARSEKKQSVCCLDAKMAVCGKCEAAELILKMDDSGLLLNLPPRSEPGCRERVPGRFGVRGRPMV